MAFTVMGYYPWSLQIKTRFFPRDSAKPQKCATNHLQAKRHDSEAHFENVKTNVNH